MAFWKQTQSPVLTEEDRFNAFAHEEHRKSDHGRTFGWVLYLGEQRIADVNYLGWDASSQFWHAYRVVPTSPAFDEIGFEVDRWHRGDLSLESRFAVGYRVTEFLTAVRADQVVLIRAASVPEDVFLKAQREAHEAMNKLQGSPVGT